MKNRLFLAFAAILFAAITVFNINLAHQGTAGDIILEGVELEAGATEGTVDDNPFIPPGACSPQYHYTVTVNITYPPGVSVSCTTGGWNMCPLWSWLCPKENP